MNPRDWRLAPLAGVLLVLFFHFATNISWQGSVLRAAVGLGAGLVGIGMRRTPSRDP